MVGRSENLPVVTRSTVMPSLSASSGWMLGSTPNTPMEPVMVFGWATMVSQAMAM